MFSELIKQILYHSKSFHEVTISHEKMILNLKLIYFDPNIFNPLLYENNE